MLYPEGEEELRNLEEFKQRVADLNQDETTCLRFLRAREQNLDKAESMIRRTIKWREDVQISKYRHWKPSPAVLEDTTFYTTGTDYEGRPVFWLPMGRWNTRVLVEQGYKEDVSQLRYYLLETLTEVIRQSKADQCMVIFGVEGLTYWKVAHMETMQMMMDSFRDLSLNYPEIIKSMFVINTPWYFPYVLTFVKPLLSTRTSRKLNIFNSDKSKWLAALLEVMPKESVPREYWSDEMLQEEEEGSADEDARSNVSSSNSVPSSSGSGKGTDHNDKDKGSHNHALAHAGQ
jgi:hypothetical protein